MSEFIELLYSRFLLSSGVSIDTRTIEKDNLFFAISGENFDANKFAAEALEKGASFAVVDDESFVTDERLLLAANCLEALQELAVFHRTRFKHPVVGITGSNGKTTTKELITRVLAEKYIVHATQGNYNNHIGVPLTLLQIHPQVELAVVEMGANHVGEIAQLCSFAHPTVGLITNIGHAHTETFGGIEGVIRGKSELFDFLKKTQGQVLINSNDPVLSNMAKRFENPILYPAADVELQKSEPFLSVKVGNDVISSQLIGSYNFENVAAAISIGRYFKIPDQNIINAIASYLPDNARSQVITKDSLTILLDAYNANPDSMKGALTSLSRMEGKRIAIIGDMNELENSEKEHQQIIDFAKELDLEVITTGAKMGLAKGANQHFDKREELMAYLKSRKFPDSNVLLKASRSIELESVLEYILP